MPSMCKEPFVFISKRHPVALFMWGLVKYRECTPTVVPGWGCYLLISVKCAVRRLEYTHEHACLNDHTHTHTWTGKIIGLQFMTEKRERECTKLNHFAPRRPNFALVFQFPTILSGKISFFCALVLYAIYTQYTVYQHAMYYYFLVVIE